MNFPVDSYLGIFYNQDRCSFGLSLFEWPSFQTWRRQAGFCHPDLGFASGDSGRRETSVSNLLGSVSEYRALLGTSVGRTNWCWSLEPTSSLFSVPPSFADTCLSLDPLIESWIHDGKAGSWRLAHLWWLRSQLVRLDHRYSTSSSFRGSMAGTELFASFDCCFRWSKDHSRTSSNDKYILSTVLKELEID